MSIASDIEALGPITPPPELFKQWEDDILNGRDNVDHVLGCAWSNGFQAGADQELEACCEWVRDSDGYDAALGLRADRRPALTLKEQARDALGRFFSNAHTHASQMTQDFDLLRRAVEQLP